MDEGHGNRQTGAQNGVRNSRKFDVFGILCTHHIENVVLKSYFKLLNMVFGFTDTQINLFLSIRRELRIIRRGRDEFQTPPLSPRGKVT